MKARSTRGDGVMRETRDKGSVVLWFPQGGGKCRCLLWHRLFSIGHAVHKRARSEADQPGKVVLGGTGNSHCSMWDLGMDDF